jgi:hypothetical protein
LRLLPFSAPGARPCLFFINLAGIQTEEGIERTKPKQAGKQKDTAQHQKKGPQEEMFCTINIRERGNLLLSVFVKSELLMEI